jgi:hypothetical protein
MRKKKHQLNLFDVEPKPLPKVTIDMVINFKMNVAGVKIYYYYKKFGIWDYSVYRAFHIPRRQY